MIERYGLIGYPLGHSFSQRYFTEKFAAENINARYDLFPIASIDCLEKLLKECENLKGFNVTIPYKQEVMRFLDELDEQASEIGAVNVVKITYDKTGKRHLKGFNSDAYGFTESIRPLVCPTHKKALVLGSGGASKAVIYSLKKLGIEPVVVSRHPNEGQLGYSELADHMSEFTVIVNASPVGMSPKVDCCPDIPYELLTSKHLCFDLVYNPEETLFLHKAHMAGAVTKNGLEMLHLQAEGAWLYWNK